MTVRSVLPHLLFVLSILAKTLCLLVIVAGAAAMAFVFWVVLVKVAVGLAIIGLFALVTYPSKAVGK